MNESTANRLSLIASVLILLFSASGNPKLMLFASAAVLIFGLLFYQGKMKAKIAMSSLLGFATAILITRFLSN